MNLADIYTLEGLKEERDKYYWRKQELEDAVFHALAWLEQHPQHSKPVVEALKSVLVTEPFRFRAEYMGEFSKQDPWEDCE